MNDSGTPRKASGRPKESPNDRPYGPPKAGAFSLMPGEPLNVSSGTVAHVNRGAHHIENQAPRHHNRQLQDTVSLPPIPTEPNTGGHEQPRVRQTSRMSDATNDTLLGPGSGAATLVKNLGTHNDPILLDEENEEDSTNDDDYGDYDNSTDVDDDRSANNNATMPAQLSWDEINSLYARIVLNEAAYKELLWQLWDRNALHEDLAGVRDKAGSMEKLPSKTHGQRNLHPKPTLETLFENVKQKPQIYGLIIKAQMAREQGNSQLYGQPDASRAQERTEKEGGESTQAYARRENDASRSVFQAFMAVIAQAGRAQARTVPGGESTQAHAQPENDTALLHSLATIRADALREEAYSKAEAARCKASGLPTGDADALHTAAAIKSLHADVNHRSEYKRQVEKFHRTEYQRQTGQAHAPWEIPPEAPDFAYIVNAIDNALARPHFPRKFHGCTSDGHFVYKTHIQPLVLKIREVAAHPASAGFAVQWVALLALMHILRLLYFHKSGGGRVCNEVVDWYEADAGHPDGDEITAGMQAIFKEMDLVSSVWMRQGDGAAGVLVRELQDLCLVLRKEAAPQVYHGLKLVLEIHFRQRVVSMAVEGGVEGWGFEAMWIP